ncbi:phytanoyl-CoA dioxygenase [Candidatus Poribacteria bacterium]|nr:phytanoyl-CoA dioxygenase [Candidatus Poribacteria bacterium]
MTEISHKNRINVPKRLSENQVQFFIDHGYIAVPDLIESDEIEELREDTVRIARGGYPCEAVQPTSENLSDDQILANILCIHQPHFISPIMEKYVKHPELCGVLSQITAAHIPFWDGSVKCMQSMLFVKPSGFQGQSWHQDEIYIPTRDRSLIGGWIAMDDATVENGCLWVIPGSHQMGYLYSQKPHGNPDEFDSADLESYGFDETLEVPIEVKTGTVVFFNGYLLHRSRKNRGQTYRRVLVNHYCNAWSLLPWSIKDDERPANADRRSVIPVSGIDPYAWKGYEETSRNIYFRHCKAVDDLEKSTMNNKELT